MPAEHAVDAFAAESIVVEWPVTGEQPESVGLDDRPTRASSSKSSSRTSPFRPPDRDPLGSGRRAWRNLRRLKTLRAPRAVWEAYRQGRRALCLIGADWENFLVQPLATVRARFRVAAPGQYPQLRERSDAAVAAETARLATA
jgi:hypothetical protein